MTAVTGTWLSWVLLAVFIVAPASSIWLENARAAKRTGICSALFGSALKRKVSDSVGNAAVFHARTITRRPR